MLPPSTFLVSRVPMVVFSPDFLHYSVNSCLLYDFQIHNQLVKESNYLWYVNETLDILEGLRLFVLNLNTLLSLWRFRFCTEGC